MRNLNWLALVFWTLLLPTAAASAENGLDQSDMEIETDAFVVHKVSTVDNRLMALEKEFSLLIQAAVDRLRSQSDPLQREALQKEIHELKENHLIGIAELQLEIALEEGNETLAAELEKLLQHFSMPVANRAMTIEDRPPPQRAGAENAGFSRIDPDDVP